MNFFEILSGIKIITLSALFAIHSFSYLYTILRNPGIPSRKSFHRNPIAKNGIKRYSYCKFCKIIKNLDIKTYHCHLCSICVEGIFNIFLILLGHDHHCNFLNKCIGMNNLKSFYIFIMSTNVYFGYAIYLIVTI